MAKDNGNTSITPTLDRLTEIDIAHEDAERDLRRLLELRGWKSTCDTPGSVWLFEKKLPDGRTILVNADTAADFERHLCGEGEL